MVLIALILDQLKNREPLLNLGKNDFENAAFGPTRPGRRLTLWKTTDLVTFFGPARPEANTLENYRFGHVFRPDPARPDANTLENYRFGHVFRPGRRVTPWKTIDLVTFFGQALPEANTSENCRFGHVFC